jgi:hypothetical protein
MRTLLRCGMTLQAIGECAKRLMAHSPTALSELKSRISQEIIIQNEKKMLFFLSRLYGMESQAGFGTTFKAQADIRKPEQALGRGLLEGISQLVSDFIEASRIFILDFLHKKTSVKTKKPYSKSTVSKFRTLKKIFIS